MKNRKSFISGLIVGMIIIITINTLFFGFKIVLGMSGKANLASSEKLEKILRYLNKYYVDDIDM